MCPPLYRYLSWCPPLYRYLSWCAHLCIGKPVNNSCASGFYSCGASCRAEKGEPTEPCNGACPPSRSLAYVKRQSHKIFQLRFFTSTQQTPRLGRNFLRFLMQSPLDISAVWDTPPNNFFKLSNFHALKGLSSKMEGSIKLVALERSSLKQWTWKQIFFLFY